MYILISILMVVVGTIGIIKNKLPKYRSSAGFSIEIMYYIAFYVLVIMGVVVLILEIFGDN